MPSNTERRTFQMAVAYLRQLQKDNDSKLGAVLEDLTVLEKGLQGQEDKVDSREEEILVKKLVEELLSILEGKKDRRINDEIFYRSIHQILMILAKEWSLNIEDRVKRLPIITQKDQTPRPRYFFRTMAVFAGWGAGIGIVALMVLFPWVIVPLIGPPFLAAISGIAGLTAAGGWLIGFVAGMGFLIGVTLAAVIVVAAAALAGALVLGFLGAVIGGIVDLVNDWMEKKQVDEAAHAQEPSEDQSLLQQEKAETVEKEKLSEDLDSKEKQSSDAHAVRAHGLFKHLPAAETQAVGHRPGQSPTLPSAGR